MGQGTHRSIRDSSISLLWLWWSGLTLAPSVAGYASRYIVRSIEQQMPAPIEIIVLGAGYVGILTALKLRSSLDDRGYSETPITVLSHAFPKGISSLLQDFTFPEHFILNVLSKVRFIHTYWTALIQG